MKVLIDAHAAIEKKTGIGRYSDNLITALSKNKELQTSIYSNLPQRKLEKVYLKYPSYSSRFKNGFYRIFIGLSRATKLLHPNIIHVNNFAPLWKTVPIVVTIHDVCFKTCAQKYPLKTRIIFGLFFPHSLKIADAIICISEATKTNLLRQYSVDENKITVIHEACDSNFKPISNKKKVRKKIEKKFGIKEDYFLVVGNIEKRKKPFEILEVFEKLIKINKNAQLVFAGPNTLKNFPPSESEKLIKSGRLKILGYISNEALNMLYNEAVALIYDSYCEGFGLPLLEAMNCHTPVICSDLPVMREIAGDAAIFVKNKKGLFQAMKLLSENKTLRKKLIRRGKKQAQNFSWEKTAKETIKVYKRYACQE
jgi:glycosyltransferase involved in cell wall biosynthesis